MTHARIQKETDLITSTHTPHTLAHLCRNPPGHQCFDRLAVLAGSIRHSGFRRELSALGEVFMCRKELRVLEVASLVHLDVAQHVEVSDRADMIDVQLAEGDVVAVDEAAIILVQMNNVF
jgi:hypothetical protein